MKKIFIILTILLVSVSLNARKLVIVHLNDTHSHFEPIRTGDKAGLGGVIERAAFVDSLRKAEGKNNVLLVHAGDFSQGTSYFTELKGDLEIEEINALKYDCVALGNHEFDNGVEELTRRAKMTKTKLVCANYDFSEYELSKYVKPYAIVRKAGLKIGIIGLVTDVSRVVDRSVSDKLKRIDEVEVTQKWVDYLKNVKHCDFVMALTHIGFKGEEFTDPVLISKVKGLDLVVGGHSHTFLQKMEAAVDPDGYTVPIVQIGCWGLEIGKIEVVKK